MRTEIVEALRFESARLYAVAVHLPAPEEFAARCVRDGRAFAVVAVEHLRAVVVVGGGR
jgi:hypothetical protein